MRASGIRNTHAFLESFVRMRSRWIQSTPDATPE
jgi:hypothetical protein